MLDEIEEDKDIEAEIKELMMGSELDAAPPASFDDPLPEGDEEAPPAPGEAGEDEDDFGGAPRDDGDDDG